MQDNTLPSAGADRMCEDCADTADRDSPEDIFEIELDGVTHTLPAALKGAFLRQADYTRKTQELAEQRRAMEAERQALAEHAVALDGVSEDRVRLAALDHQLAEFEGIDWNALAAQDPRAAETLWGAAQRLDQARQQLATAVDHHHQGRRLQAAREAAEAMVETGRRLSQEIEGWSPEMAAKLVEYAQAFGVTTDELAHTADPRLWKLLHKAWRADQTEQRDARADAPTVRPAVVVAGGGAGGAGVRDELSTKEWMRRRNEQTRKGR
jgi:hypothetical protein